MRLQRTTGLTLTMTKSMGMMTTWKKTEMLDRMRLQRTWEYMLTVAMTVGMVTGENEVATRHRTDSSGDKDSGDDDDVKED